MSDFGVLEFLSTERFTIQSCLGVGDFGAVYRAYDKKKDLLVALKKLNNLEPKEILAFRNEFRILADINHPNLAKLYELFFEKGQGFFTMELVEGISILEYIWRKTTEEVLWQQNVSITTELNWETKAVGIDREISATSTGVARVSKTLLSSPARFDYLRKALIQLVEGIMALHDAGKLHRDIKPSNVLVTKQDKIAILNSGLVAALASQEVGENRGIYGTVDYMSPEQGSGMPVTEATDWYSVGVIFYEALTGKLPFADPLPMKVLISKIRYKPVPPNELVAEIPPELEELCMDLLCCDPMKRPKGREILHRLKGYETKESQKNVLRTLDSTFFQTNVENRIVPLFECQPLSQIPEGLPPKPIDSLTPVLDELKQIQQEAEQKSQAILDPLKNIGRLYLLSKADETFVSVLSNPIKRVCGVSTNEEVHFHIRTAKNKKYLGLYWPENSNEKKQAYKSIGRLEVVLYQLVKEDGTLIPRISEELKEIYSDKIPSDAEAYFSVEVMDKKQHLIVCWGAGNNTGTVDIGEMDKLLKDNTPTQEQDWANRLEITRSRNTKLQDKV